MPSQIIFRIESSLFNPWYMTFIAISAGNVLFRKSRKFAMDMFFLSGQIKIKKKISKNFNLPKIMEKTKKIQKAILIMIEIGP